VIRPTELKPAAGDLLVGSGAVRYRDIFEAAGASIPPDDDERHLPRASLHAKLARDFTVVEAIEPLYLRAPDADRTLS
jgi:hypothetical protein